MWLSKKEEPDWSFQVDAIKALIRDFKESATARVLLVIPTGGGKTLTAIRTVSEMYKNGLLKTDNKVLWVVHTLALKANAEKAIKKDDNKKKFRFAPSLEEKIEVCMKSEAARRLLADNSGFGLIVIDEAHHTAASTYGDFFEYPLPILGLTATPTRSDHRPLPFGKISYSITFSELVKRKVVLVPTFLPEVRTGLRIDISSLEDEAQLERFNSQERNEIVANHIFRESRKHGFKKVVVFAGTNAHVQRLYDVVKRQNTENGSPFGHVGYIYGGNNNERGMVNDKYLDWHYSLDSSVLINCRILNEGYDDPQIDSIVMATPTNSILYYLQCIGRVVRTPEDYKNARAYVIEIADKLPNITYRIDNRWLYAEISDCLEPRIEDVNFIWPLNVIVIIARLIGFQSKLTDVTPGEWKSIWSGEKISFLLFNDIPDSHRGVWRILPISIKKTETIRLFNDLSENMEDYASINHDYLFEHNYKASFDSLPFSSRAFRSALFVAMKRAYNQKKRKEIVDSLVYISNQ